MERVESSKGKGKGKERWTTALSEERHLAVRIWPVQTIPLLSEAMMLVYSIVLCGYVHHIQQAKKLTRKGLSSNN